MDSRSLKPAIVSAIAVAVTLGLAAIAAESKKSDKAPGKAPEKETVLSGKVLDLHTHMAGGTMGKSRARSSAQLIRSGVPVVLETDKGLVIVGVGRKVSPRTIAKHAGARVELKGTLYEKDNLRYLDVTAVVVSKEKATKSTDTKSKRRAPRRKLPAAEPE